MAHGRQVVRDILDGKDHRLFGGDRPCSIHDIKAPRIRRTASRRSRGQVADTLFLVMRVYFEAAYHGGLERPDQRSVPGRLVQDQDGLHIGRQLLRDLAEKGLPTATEALDPISPQYLQDLISWSAIGARTTESQTHREMASGLSSAVGFRTAPMAA